MPTEVLYVLNQRCEIIQNALQHDQQLSNNQTSVLTDVF
jgi:hypothetical protein